MRIVQDMDDSYLNVPADPTPKRALAWLAALLVLRAKSPVQLAAFFSLNPKIKEWVVAASNSHARLKDRRTVERRASKIANGASVALLFAAVRRNPSIPKDYLLLYLFIKYYSELNPPELAVMVSPYTSRLWKINTYPPWVRALYARRHLLVFPIIFGQLLSNYLTPTRFFLNKRYLLSDVKNHIFNPIWVNFSMAAHKRSINWAGLLGAYALHNAQLAGVYAVWSLKTHVVDRLADRAFSLDLAKSVLAGWAAHVARRANAVANLIYSPNLISMVLLVLTLPVTKRLFRHYDFKTVVKTYTKTVGVVAAAAAVALNVARGPEDGVSPEFLNGLNMYLFRLVVLQKWRIAKDNHPWFSVLNVGNWENIESAVLCYGVWKLMNLSDWIRMNRYGPHHVECERLEQDGLMQAVGRITS